MTQPTDTSSSASAASATQPMPSLSPESVEVTPLLIKHCQNFADFGGQEVWTAIVQDLLDRNELGFRTYGTLLYTFNGRNALLDTYQELLDAAKYCQQSVTEKKGDGVLVLLLILRLLRDVKEALMKEAEPISPVQAG